MFMHIFYMFMHIFYSYIFQIKLFWSWLIKSSIKSSIHIKNEIIYPIVVYTANYILFILNIYE